MTTYSTDSGLKISDLQSFQESFKSNRINQVAMNAITHCETDKVALNRDALSKHRLTFSTDIKSGDITAQKRSGRCWMFAALNAFRLKAMEKMNLKSFELSQSYTMFYDKLEKSNYFLENVLHTLDEDTDSRLFMWLLQSPLNDGGQWDMFVNLVNKYGVVPKEVYPESISSSATPTMNQHLTEKLREFASVLRSEHKKGTSFDSLREQKQKMMHDIYRVLAIHNGEPPQSFRWSWRDKDDQYHEHPDEITPAAFFKEYVNFEMEDYCSLIHCPTEDKAFDTLFTVSYLGNVAEGHPVRYLNVEMDVLKQATLSCLKNGEAVWFGCDVGKQLSRPQSILDTETYQFDLLYSMPFNMNKGERVSYGHSLMTHAMLLTGVHEEAGQTIRWKVENSWGKDGKHDGFLIMSDDWFNEYLFQVVVPISQLPADKQALLKNDPVTLKPWDPMGSLAAMR